MRLDRSFDVVLLDGGTVRMRVAESADAPRIQAFHGRLSDETVYLRYCSAMRELLRRLLERFTRADPAESLDLLALVSGQLVADHGYTGSAGSDDAEVAFVVDDAHHGRGLATLLLECLAGIARENGIGRFVAETLPHNRKMLGVFRDAGFRVRRERRDGVVHLLFPLDATPELEAATARRQRRAEAHSVERLLEPASIAVVAGRTSPACADGAARRVLQNLLAGEFSGRLHWVDPDGAPVRDLRAYPRPEDVGDEVRAARRRRRGSSWGRSTGATRKRRSAGRASRWRRSGVPEPTRIGVGGASKATSPTCYHLRPGSPPFGSPAGSGPRSTGDRRRPTQPGAR